MKKHVAWTLVLCIFLGSVAFAQNTSSKKHSFAPQPQTLPAAGLVLDVPADFDSFEGDEEAYDLGFRLNCHSETFFMEIWVKDNREMTLAEYAELYRQKSAVSFAISPDTINGIPVQRLVQSDNPNHFVILVAEKDVNTPLAAYVLSFQCDGEADVRLANEILLTLRPADME